MNNQDVGATDRASMRGENLTVVAALAEPKRRAVYEYVADSGGWVSRDQAADGVGLERPTAAHHLDRLVTAGLLEIDYRRLSNRSGPGAGRPSKLYRRAPRDFGVSFPPRDYELAGQLLAAAVATAQHGGEGVAVAVERAATGEGERFAEDMRARLADPAGNPDADAHHDIAATDERLQVGLEVLTEHGFEPHRADPDTVVLRNCPFHQLVANHPDLVCNMNLCLLRAAFNGLGGTGYAATFEPEDGLCCVKLRRL